MNARLGVIFCLSCFFPSFAAKAAVTCDQHKIEAGPRNGNKNQYLTIDKALKAARSGWDITVGKGPWNERIKISQEDHLTLSSACAAQIEGIDIERSQSVTISGFTVTVRNGTTGITLADNLGANQDITILNNTITGFHDAGILVGVNNKNITIKGNHITANGQGIIFSRKTDGHQNITENDVEDNRQNGILLSINGSKPSMVAWVIDLLSGLFGYTRDRDEADFVLKDNIIYHNGIGGPSASGYGLKVEASLQINDPVSSF